MLIFGCMRHRDTGELLRSYIQDANSHDIPKLRAKFTEDIVWFLGPDTLIGKDAVIAPHEFDAGARTRLTIKSYIVRGDTVETVFEEINDYMDTLGMPAIIRYAHFIFHNDLLARIKPSRSPLVPPLVDSIDQRWNQWMQSVHPEAWTRIMKPNGSINFSRETGELLLHLACEWRQSMQK
jgi:hypothetical protein